MVGFFVWFGDFFCLFGFSFFVFCFFFLMLIGFCHQYQILEEFSPGNNLLVTTILLLLLCTTVPPWIVSLKKNASALLASLIHQQLLIVSRPSFHLANHTNVCGVNWTRSVSRRQFGSSVPRLSGLQLLESWAQGGMVSSQGAKTAGTWVLLALRAIYFTSLLVSPLLDGTRLLCEEEFVYDS